MDKILSGKIDRKLFKKLHQQASYYHSVPYYNYFMVFIAEFCLPVFVF